MLSLALTGYISYEYPQAVAQGREGERTLIRADFNDRNLAEEGEAIPGAVSSLTDWVGIGLFVVLLAWVLAGIWMFLVHGMPLPLENICLRG